MYTCIYLYIYILVELENRWQDYGEAENKPILELFSKKSRGATYEIDFQVVACCLPRRLYHTYLIYKPMSEVDQPVIPMGRKVSLGGLGVPWGLP